MLDKSNVLYTNIGSYCIDKKNRDFYYLHVNIIGERDLIERPNPKTQNSLILDYKVNYKHQNWLYNPSNTSLDLIEALHVRASDISKKQYDKYNIFWSGGIDSTFIICIMLQYVDKKQINIILNDYSISKSPSIYKFLKDSNIETTNVQKDISIIRNYVRNNNCILNDVLGWFNFGALYAPDRMNELLFDNNKKQISVYDFFRKMQNSIEFAGIYNIDLDTYYNPKRNLEKEVFPYIDKFIERSYMPIKGAYDYFVYLCSDLSYTTCKYCRHDLINDNYENLITFFESPELESISVNRRQDDTYIRDNYQLLLKRYIYEVTKDKEFFDKRTRVTSKFFTEHLTDEMILMDEFYKKEFFVKDKFYYENDFSRKHRINRIRLIKNKIMPYLI